MLIQSDTPTTGHPLADTVARFAWLLPTLPLLGFLVNGWLSLRAAGKFGPADPSATDRHEGHEGAGAHGAAEAHGHDGHDDHHVARHPAAKLVSLIGPGVMVLAFGVALAVFVAMRAAGDAMHVPYVLTLFQWMPTGKLAIDVALQLDQLSMVMTLIITGVGMLIHIFSVGYMQDDPGYPRYFAYLNLFVFFMLLLVLGSSYPLMFVGWEGVGLCSYLLIGFWFSDKANADAGKKAFIVNRIGDFGFLVAMFLMFANFGTMSFAGVERAANGLDVGSLVATAICLFLFLGATGKSAQIPLFTWLPDAMAGPTTQLAIAHVRTKDGIIVDTWSQRAGTVLGGEACKSDLKQAGRIIAINRTCEGVKEVETKKLSLAKGRLKTE
jgi:NADH-quinone oxidoreductase subunit L